MSTEKMQASFRLLMLMTTPKLAEKALLLFEKGRLPMQIQAYAHGTASREMMDMLGLDSGEKSLLLTVMPKADADDLLVHLRRELRLGLSGSGIAFTVPMSGANKRVLQMVQQLCEEKPRAEIRRKVMQENEYQIIVALVTQGYSEEVMAAARPAGAAGGTVLHSRRVGAEEALSQWGFSLQEEKEAVMILTRAESKLAIMQAICDSCGLQSEAQGIVLSLPVDRVVGLEETELNPKRGGWSCQANNTDISSVKLSIFARRFPKGDRKALWWGDGAKPHIPKCLDIVS